jgi:hypothetical protein
MQCLLSAFIFVIFHLSSDLSSFCLLPGTFHLTPVRFKSKRFDMAPKIKVKKAKGESEENKLIREEADRKERDAEAKDIADEAERLRSEHLRIQSERREFRIAELASLNEENVLVLEKLSLLESRIAAEIFSEVTYKRMNLSRYQLFQGASLSILF